MFPATEEGRQFFFSRALRPFILQSWLSCYFSTSFSVIPALAALNCSAILSPAARQLLVHHVCREPEDCSPGADPAAFLPSSRFAVSDDASFSNQLNLRYWKSVRKDHLGEPFPVAKAITPGMAAQESGTLPALWVYASCLYGINHHR